MMFVQVNTGSRQAKRHPIGYTIEANGCWLWTGTRHYKGYGLWRQKKAHRIMYERYVGPIPAGLVLDHFACDNPSCVNPAHVRPVTSRENTLRSPRTLASQQLARTHCIHGHPLSGDNLRPSREGRRRCRTCKNASQRVSYAAQRAA